MYTDRYLKANMLSAKTKDKQTERASNGSSKDKPASIVTNLIWQSNKPFIAAIEHSTTAIKNTPLYGDSWCIFVSNDTKVISEECYEGESAPYEDS